MYTNNEFRVRFSFSLGRISRRLIIRGEAVVGGMRGAKMTTEKSSRSSFANKAGAPSLIALRHAGCSLIV